MGAGLNILMKKTTLPPPPRWVGDCLAHCSAHLIRLSLPAPHHHTHIPSRTHRPLVPPACTLPRAPFTRCCSVSIPHTAPLAPTHVPSRTPSHTPPRSPLLLAPSRLLPVQAPFTRCRSVSSLRAVHTPFGSHLWCQGEPRSARPFRSSRRRVSAQYACEARTSRAVRAPRPSTPPSRR